MAPLQTISGAYGPSMLLSTMRRRQEEQHMSTVALIDRKMNEIIQTVETKNVQFTIDSLMRNRDPRQFVAREITINDKAWLSKTFCYHGSMKIDTTDSLIEATSAVAATIGFIQEAHAGQKYGNMPYFFHPVEVILPSKTGPV